MQSSAFELRQTEVGLCVGLWKVLPQGDVNMHLEREIAGKLVKVEWQLTSPFDPSADMEGEEGGQEYVTAPSIFLASSCRF